MEKGKREGREKGIDVQGALREKGKREEKEKGWRRGWRRQGFEKRNSKAEKMPQQDVFEMPSQWRTMTKKFSTILRWIARAELPCTTIVRVALPRPSHALRFERG